MVDYAETRREFLVPLCREIFRAEEGPIRVILLARAALDWWERLKTEGEGVGELLSGPATTRYSLQPLAFSPEERAESYRIAAGAFSEELGQPAPEELPDDIQTEHFERALLLHMAALAAIEGVSVKDEDGILDHVLDWERRFLGQLAAERELSKQLVPGIGRAMAATTLGGGVDGEDNAVAVLGALRFFEGEKRSVQVAIARLLHAVYPGNRWIEPVMPGPSGRAPHPAGNGAGRRRAARPGAWLAGFPAEPGR